MNVVELIRKKRDGFSLTEEELKWLITGYVENQIPDYQLTSFLMACYFQGMSHKETMTFTQLMLNSGKVVDLADIPGTKVDKHSTGGVGDKVSLILAPMVAACGVPVPMISGRGLGHTGGTLDKLQSIPGFRVDLNLVEYRNILRKTGVVMMGQTAEIAPADKKMYALRDVTGTIECIPLIVGSILSKKLAEGIDALVLDVKTGQGAFMRTYENSIELAQWLIKVAEAFCKPTIAFISDMNKPLGRTIGNWLEVVETVECLRSFKNTPIGSEDLMEITYLLGGTMLSLGKKASTISEGIALCKEAIANGAAYDKFLEMAEAQNGDISYIENLESYPLSQFCLEVKADRVGYIKSIDALELGLAGVTLGAGRIQMTDVIDPKAGIWIKKNVGNYVEEGETLAVIYTDREKVLSAIRSKIQNAYNISVTLPEKSPLILAVVDKIGVHKDIQKYIS